MKKVRFFFGIVFIMVGCVRLQPTNSVKPEFSLQQVENIHVGETTQAEVLNLFGKPDRVIDLSQEKPKGQGTIWAYFAGEIKSVGRLSFSFSANTVESISWDVRDGDPEQDLNTALSQFKDSKFVKVFPKRWDNPHSSPDEVFFEDTKRGLTIIYLQTPKRVEAITWSSPERITTSETTVYEKPEFPYCIVGLCASQPKP